jgi:sugar phosphate permease
MAAVISPAFGWLVEATSWQAAFLVVAVGPLAAWWLLAPLHAEESARVASDPAA